MGNDMTESQQDNWLLRHDAFIKHYSAFTKDQKCIAICVFDADSTGIRVPVTSFIKLTKVGQEAVYSAIHSMDCIAQLFKI